MFFRQFYDDRLAQASYLLGSSATGQALVADPRRDIDVYLAAAAEHDLSIVAVTETHIHADFLSGARELARATGATLYLSGEGASDAGYTRDNGANAHFLRDGEDIRLGEVRVRALHTPGHTPEHMCFAVFDGAAQADPMLLLSGDCIFVGDLGRPDLLESALGQAGAAQTGAHQMYGSVRTLLASLPDFVQVWPAHGAGSACGRALGAVPSTTLGYERRVSWWSPALERGDEAGFVAALLQGQPDAASYFATMKRLNRGGAPLLGRLPQPPQLDAAGVAAHVRSGGSLVDTRPRESFIRSHARGAIHIPDGSSFSNWSAWFVPPDAAVVLIANPTRVDDLVRGLVRVGIDHVAGFVPESVAEGLPQEPLPQLDASAAREQISGQQAATLDIRSRSEYDAAHMHGSMHISAGKLLSATDGLPKDRTLILFCAQGERSVAATSMLRARGFDNAVNLSGGFNGWRAR